MPFTPIQQIMLVVYEKAQAAGIQISSATLISTTYLWPVSLDYYWRGNPPNNFGADGWSIQAVNQAYTDLVNMGKIPSLN